MRPLNLPFVQSHDRNWDSPRPAPRMEATRSASFACSRVRYTYWTEGCGKDKEHACVSHLPSRMLHGWEEITSGSKANSLP